MIAVDTNVLIYAHFSRFAKHRAALTRLTELAESHSRWGIPIFCLGEFLRLATHRRLFEASMSTADACKAIKRLTESPGLSVLLPGERYLPLLEKAVMESEASGNLVFDAQIVALCREVGVHQLLTEDRDYARFPGFPTARLSE